MNNRNNKVAAEKPEQSRQDIKLSEMKQIKKNQNH